MRGRILLIDPDSAFRKGFAELLQKEGFETFEVSRLEDAQAAIRRDSYDVVLVEIDLPDNGGMDLINFLHRAAPETRVIILTKTGSLETAIEAIRLDVHDYFIKPVEEAEILASIARGISWRVDQQRKRLYIEQIDASVQRLRELAGLEMNFVPSTDEIILEDGLVVDLLRREIWQGDQRVSLTPTEGKLLKVLAENRGRVISHHDLVLLIHGYETAEWEAPEVLRPLVSRLRRKFAMFPHSGDWIVSVRGTGYALRSKDEMVRSKKTRSVLP